MLEAADRNATSRSLARAGVSREHETTLDQLLGSERPANTDGLGLKQSCRQFFCSERGPRVGL